MAETIIIHASQLLFCGLARDPFALLMQTHLTAGGSTVMASANLRMSLVSSSISRLSQLLKTARPIRSRAASRRSVIAFPFGETTAWRTRRSAALARRLTRPRLSSLATWRLTVGKSRPTEWNPSRVYQKFGARRPVHGGDNIQHRAVKLAQLNADTCILHVSA